MPQATPQWIQSLLEESARRKQGMGPLGSGDQSNLPQLPSLERRRGMEPPQGRKDVMRQILARSAGGTPDTGFKTPEGGGYPGPDLSGATLPPGPDVADRQQPSPTIASSPPSDDAEKLRLLQAARQFREGASQFRNVTGESEMWLNRGRVPDRSVRDTDARAEEERVRIGDPHNPESSMSQSARGLYEQMTGKKAPQTMTAAQVMTFAPMLKNILQGDVAARGDALAAAATFDRSQRAGRAEGRAERKEGREAADYARERGDVGAVGAGDLTQLPQEARDSLEGMRTAFYTNSRINGLKGQAQAAKSIKSRIDASASFGATSAFRALARAAGEVGVMTDKDIKDFSERMGYMGLYDRVYKFGKSELPPELRDEIFKVADTFAADATQELETEIGSRVGSLRQQYPYIQEETLRNFFMPEEIDMDVFGADPAADVADPAAPGGAADPAGVGGEVYLRNKAGQERGPVSREEAERRVSASGGVLEIVQ